MKKCFISFTTLFLALSTVPVNVFARYASFDTGVLDRWFYNTFCDPDVYGYGFKISDKMPYHCDKYRDDIHDTYVYQDFLAFQRLVKRTETEDKLLSYIETIDTSGRRITSVKCLPGFKHPDPKNNLDTDFVLSCIEDPNYTDEYRKQQFEKIIATKTQKSGTQTQSEVQTAIAQEIKPAVETGSVGPAVYTEEDARRDANANYAEQLRNRTNWDAAEIEEANKITTPTNATAKMNTPVVETGSVGPAVYNDGATQQNNKRKNSVDWCLESEMGPAAPDCQAHNECDAKGAAYEWDEKTGKCISLRPEVTPLKTKQLDTEKLDTNAQQKQQQIQQRINDGKKLVQDAITAGVHAGSTIDATKYATPEVTEELKKWDDACEKSKGKDHIKKTYSKLTNIGSQLQRACLVEKCDDGYVKSNNDTSCVEDPNAKLCADKKGRWDKKNCWCGTKKQSLEPDAAACPTKEEKKTERLSAKEEKEIDKIVKAIKASTETMAIGSKIGAKITREQEQNERISAALDEWLNACYAVVAKTPNVLKDGETANDAYSHANTTGWTCLLRSCNEPAGYETSADHKSCVAKQDEQTPNDNDAKFIADVDKFISAFNAVNKKICEKQKAVVGEGQEVAQQRANLAYTAAYAKPTDTELAAEEDSFGWGSV